MAEPLVKTRVYAHRGASATHPENSLAAFEAALGLGVDGVELDIRSTADGVPVVSHDGNLRRTLGIDRALSDISSGDLREIAPSIPTFAEVLALIDGRCHLDVEIKEAGVEQGVLDRLASLPHDRWAISSFDWDILREIRGLDEAAELWVLSLAVSPGALEAADGLDATTLAVEQSAITREVVTRASEVGRRMMAWTVNDPARAAALAGLGVAVICTDDPASVMSVLSAR